MFSLETGALNSLSCHKKNERIYAHTYHFFVLILLTVVFITLYYKLPKIVATKEA